MPLPIVASLLMSGLQENEKMNQMSAAEEAALNNNASNSIMQKRIQRKEAADEIQPVGRSGLPGMDIMSPATNRQIEIFNNVMSRYRPQQQTGGM